MRKLNKRQVIQTVLEAKITNDPYPQAFRDLDEDDLDDVFKIEDNPYDTVIEMRKTLPKESRPTPPEPGTA